MLKQLLNNTLLAKGWLKYWSIYLILFPFYFFPSGTIQISDGLMALLLLFSVFNGRMNYRNIDTRSRKYFFYLLIYICTVNIIVSLSRIGLRDKGIPSYFMNSFYIYNFMVYLFALSLYKLYTNKFISCTLFSILLAVVFQVVLSPFAPDTNERGSLFFNNPNQLGYYCICSLCIILILERKVKISRIWIYVGFVLCSYLAMVSVSKSALGSLVILFFIYLSANKLLSIKTILTIIVIGIAIPVTLLTTDFGAEFIEKLNSRIEDATKPADVTEWEYRGYDRIANHPGYLVLGAGEGAYNRFDTYIENHEIHSSIGTIAFCYGIPGTVLFFLFLFSLIKNMPWAYFAYLVPVFAYGITHMGLRFTIFWVALSMFPVLKTELKREKWLKYQMRLKKNEITSS